MPASDSQLQAVTLIPEMQGVRPDILTRWQPGKSPNPGGRPKGSERPDVIYLRLLQLPDEELANYKPKTVGERLAYNRILEASKIETRYALPAHQEIADRTFGKAVQRTESITVAATVDINELARSMSERYNRPIEQVLRDLGLPEASEDDL